MNREHIPWTKITGIIEKDLYLQTLVTLNWSKSTQLMM